MVHVEQVNPWVAGVHSTLHSIYIYSNQNTHYMFFFALGIMSHNLLYWKPKVADFLQRQINLMKKLSFYAISCSSSIKTEPSSELTSWEIYLQWI
jgi:hypothetical protein